MENVYRPIDPSHPLASSFNQGILNNENNVDSILKFVSDKACLLYKQNNKKTRLIKCLSIKL